MTDAESRPVVVLDSCCVIEWLKDEPEYQAEAAAVGRLINKAARGEIVALVSTAVIAEVLPGAHGRYGDFLRILDEELTVQALTVNIAKVVAYLREELNFTGARRILDAIHLGTAIHSRADFLCTRDNALIALNERLPQLREHKPVPGFRICKPQEVAFS